MTFLTNANGHNAGMHGEEAVVPRAVIGGPAHRHCLWGKEAWLQRANPMFFELAVGNTTGAQLLNMDHCLVPGRKVGTKGGNYCNASLVTTTNGFQAA